MRFARVVVDVAARSLVEPFDYAIPAELASEIRVGSAVLVAFGSRRAVGYVVEVVGTSAIAEAKPIEAVLSDSFFDERAATVAAWIADEYVCGLADAVRLFLPPGGTPTVRAERDASGQSTWILERPAVGAVDDRWVSLAERGSTASLPARATTQRAVLDALSAGPVRTAELAAELGSIDSALRRLSELGLVEITHVRRVRGTDTPPRGTAQRPEDLTRAQQQALDAVRAALGGSGGVILLDGVTGSGKTEVYLQAIEGVLEDGGGAIVLVPEISLTPQTVGRFRARFGDLVAVLHSRLSPGERFDQWDLAGRGVARVVVGARSAVFAPVRDLRLVVIDEEHESSYKQSSTPRYHARDVAAKLCELAGGTLVLGSATPSMETRSESDRGNWTRVRLPERVGGRPLPEVAIVDMTREFAESNRSMFSRPLADGLREVATDKSKAVLLLNRRGFASFMLCRACGYVPTCPMCSTSLTYHEVGQNLACHHCGRREPVPAQCPTCASPYLRMFGSGTQRVERELQALVPNLPVVRMDADTTRGKGGHERRLAAFEALDSGVLLGTQMVAKGLDYPDVTLVGVVNADTTLHLPDFRAGERTYQLIEQVAGRAGRGARLGRVIVQSYWPDHPALLATVAHDPEVFYSQERAAREALGYPPYGRLVNVHITGADLGAVKDVAEKCASVLEARLPEGWTLLGPAPAPLSRLKGSHRWHLLVKAPPGAAVSAYLRESLSGIRPQRGVSLVPDVDPADVL